MAGYMSAMFQGWEQLGRVKMKDMAHQCFKIQNSSAIYKDLVYISLVLRWGVAQQHNETGYYQHRSNIEDISAI